MPSAAVIIPAAGNGSRMGLDHPKQYHHIADAPILVHTIRAFLGVASSSWVISRIIVVVPLEFMAATHQLLADFHLLQAPITITSGGRRRQDSVLAGLNCLTEESEIVLVHDGARPLVEPELIRQCLEATGKYGAAIAAIPVKDTLKKARADGENSIIASTVDRRDLWQAQTPQGARLSLFKQAYAALDTDGSADDITDEASLLERAGIAVTLVMGAASNIKITHSDDLILAEKLLSSATALPVLPSFRIGHGYDAHRLVVGRPLVLGGVTIPHHLGLAGHSDADAATHALCDAILGALGAGDIGRHFPDNDPQWQGIFSITLLERVVAQARTTGLLVANADLTIVCQSPKLAPFMETMRATLAAACRVSLQQINVKATTTERMGFTGREEGVSCHAVVLLTNMPNITG
jgi:2-C-methyl-D-erythritol 4-phosphate cytidylyltransferase/2-C-methyl-D-erythritol 2,4-cyclodiphosphate synthase